MSFNFAALNKKGIDWGYNTDDFTFRKMKDLELDKIYTVHGFFQKESKNFGTETILILDDSFLNIPKGYNDLFEHLKNKEAVQAIRAGECKIKPYEYFSKKWNKNFIGFEFV